MQLAQNATMESVLEEYAHALDEKRTRANQKPHTQAFKLALGHVRLAAPNGGDGSVGSQDAFGDDEDAGVGVDQPRVEKV